VRPETVYEAAVDLLEPGATLVLYTDGLVERRAEPIAGRLELLKTVVGGGPNDLDALCDHMLGSLVGEYRGDDIAIVAIRRLSLQGRTLDMTRPAEPSTAAEVRRLIRKWLTENGADPDSAFDVVVACSEACTNAIQHAYGPAGGLLRVQAELLGEGVVITISDFGTWRSPELSRGQGAGRGFKMMQGTMDAVDVASGDEGTVVTLRRRLQIGARHS
jgi:anti-sigma regulatory factor (Ser/Thr protein kinase)